MNFQPLEKRVLVKRVEEAKTTATGIIIPDTATEKPSQATVIAVSKEVEDIVSVKDIVVFGRYSGVELTLDGVEYLVLETKDILGIVK